MQDYATMLLVYTIRGEGGLCLLPCFEETRKYSKALTNHIHTHKN